MKNEIRSILEIMREEFLKSSYEEISSIGWQERESVIIDGKKYYPTIWSQRFPDGEALLVVQLTRWYFFKLFGATDCIGFTIKEGGEPFLVDETWLMNEVGHP